MDEHNFWIKWWTITGCCVLAFSTIVAVGNNWSSQSHIDAILNLVKNGSNAVEARCAILGKDCHTVELRAIIKGIKE